MSDKKAELGKIAKIVLIIWNIVEYALIFGLLALVGILNDLPFWYYPLSAAVPLLIIFVLKCVRKSVKKDKMEKFEVKDYSNQKGDKK